MANEDKKEPEKSPTYTIPVAKKHQLLLDIHHQLAGYNLEAIVETGGHKFHLATMDSDDEMLVDGFMQTDSTPQAVSSFRKGRIAGSLRAIDGISVTELFAFPDDIREAEKAIYTASKYGRRTWEINQLYQWLGSLPMPVIDELANEYQAISRRRKESLDELKKASAKTPSGQSVDSSSPAKESSPAIQTSVG